MRRSTTVLTAILLLCAQMVFAQKSITGKVLSSADKSPIAGATVHVQGGKVTTVTLADGSYSIVVPSDAAILEITSVGFSSKNVKLAEAGVVTLDVDVRSLSEVVVTGTGTGTSRRKLAIAVESITSDKLPAAPTASVDQALVGKIAGAQISSVNGNPGQPVNILLRGVNTLQFGTMPMILIDGIESKATELNSLDLNAYERIEVIQGAAAATMYGAQGANGVIQLFSKKGKGGRFNVDASSSVAYNSLINLKNNLHKANFHSLNTNANNQVIDGSGDPLVFRDDYSDYENNVIWNSLSPTNNNNKLYNANLQYYDHYKMFFKTAKTYNNYIGVSGSRDKVDFNISASDSRQESVFTNNGKYNRSNFNSNIGIELAKGLTFRSTTQLVLTENTLVDETGRTTMYALNNSRPFANYAYKTSDGAYGAYFGDAVGVNGFNPNYMFQNGHPKDWKTDIFQTFRLNYKFLKFFEADVKYGLNYQNRDIRYQIDAQDGNLNADYWQYWLEYYSPRYSAGSPTVASESGEINNQNYKTTFQNFLPSLTMKYDFERDFHIKLPITSTTYGGFDYRKRLDQSYISYGTDAPTFTPFTAKDMTNFRIVDDSKTPFVTYGYLFDQAFDYGELFGVSGGFRTDYSSAFGKGSSPFTFPHGKAYFNPSSFRFWKGGLENVISYFKIRAAYGKAGIQPTPFQRYITLDPTNLGDRVALKFKTSSPNPNLGVEVSSELEVGTDMSIKALKGAWLKNINLAFTYWDRSTKNAIWQADAAPSTGIGTITDNLFGLKSHGIQASANISVVSTRKFTWNFTANFSKQTSMISNVKDKPVVVTSSAGSTGLVLKAGEKIGQLYGYMMLHAVDQVNPTTGQAFIPKDQQGFFSVASNGWVVYSDPTRANYKQPYVTPGQFSFGDPNPKFNMSFINDIAFNGYLNLSFQWDWVNGSHLYNQTKEWMYRDGIHGDYDNPVTINGETGAWTAFYRGVYAQVSRNGTKNYFYEDASFARLRNVSFAVDLAKWLSIKGFKKLQLVFTGRNLVTLTKYSGMDPEVSSGSSNSAFDRGVDHNTIPNIKSYQVGLNLGF